MNVYGGWRRKSWTRQEALSDNDLTAGYPKSTFLGVLWVAFGGFGLTFKCIVQVAHPIFRVGHYPRRVLACPGLSAPSSVWWWLLWPSDTG